MNSVGSGEVVVWVDETNDSGVWRWRGRWATARVIKNSERLWFGCWFWSESPMIGVVEGGGRQWVFVSVGLVFSDGKGLGPVEYGVFVLIVLDFVQRGVFVVHKHQSQTSFTTDICERRLPDAAIRFSNVIFVVHRHQSHLLFVNNVRVGDNL